MKCGVKPWRAQNCGLGFLPVPVQAFLLGEWEEGGNLEGWLFSVVHSRVWIKYSLVPFDSKTIGFCLFSFQFLPFSVRAHVHT